MMAHSKKAYFEDMDINPLLVDLYHERLGSVDRILDLGCGNGSIGRHLPNDIEVVGLDIDQDALKRAADCERVVLADLNSGSLPFSSEAFDGVIAKDILEHLDRPAAIVAEIHRVLAAGGRVIVSVPMAKPRVVWNDYTHIRGFTDDALRTLMRDHGFMVSSIKPMGGIPGAGRLGFVKQLPTLLSLPLLRRYAASHEGVFRKPIPEAE